MLLLRGPWQVGHRISIAGLGNCGIGAWGFLSSGSVHVEDELGVVETKLLSLILSFLYFHYLFFDCNFDGKVYRTYPFSYVFRRFIKDIDGSQSSIRRCGPYLSIIPQPQTSTEIRTKIVNQFQPIIKK